VNQKNAYKKVVGWEKRKKCSTGVKLMGLSEFEEGLSTRFHEHLRGLDHLSISLWDPRQTANRWPVLWLGMLKLVHLELLGQLDNGHVFIRIELAIGAGTLDVAEKSIGSPAGILLRRRYRRRRGRLDRRSGNSTVGSWRIGSRPCGCNTRVAAAASQLRGRSEGSIESKGGCWDLLVR
jgi:hypothetical protein